MNLQKGICCPNCGSEVTFEDVLSSENRKFLQNRYISGKFDDTITISRIVSEQLPEIALSSDTKSLAMSITNVVENKMETSINTLTTLSNMLTQIIQKLPDGIKSEFGDVVKMLEKIDEKTTKSAESFLQTFNELTNKPNSKGKVGEKTLAQAWQMTYPKDEVEEKGGPGKTDILIAAMIEEGKSIKITVERKAGNQKYHPKHVKEAINHAKDEGSKYAVVVYDSYDENLPNIFGPLFMDKREGITVAVTDIANNGWKMARYAFTVLELSAMGQNTEKQVDLKKISEIINDMSKIAEQINQLRKRNNSAVQACEGVRDVINLLEKTFDQNIAKLQAELVMGE